MDTFINEIQMIYDRLADGVSKEIFVNRLSYNLTGHLGSLRNMIRTASGGKGFQERLDEAVSVGRKICIFGTGTWGKSIFASNPDVDFCCFVDNNKERCGKECMGIPVIHFEDWIERKDPMTVIIAAKLYHEEIYSQLKEHRIPDEWIINAGQMIDEANKIQYFDLAELKKHKIENEIFVDVGAFDGQSSVMFVQWAGKYKKIIVLEPDPKNREKCKQSLEAIGAEYEMLPFGAWDRPEQLFFISGLNGASHIEECNQENSEKKIVIQVDALDNLIHEEVSYMKMDIEGAEINALKGAENIIKKYKPKLAICVYHKKEDIWEIPKLILGYVPEYKLYLRHYSPFKDETVLYCIAE